MKQLFIQQLEILEKYNILITYFSYDDKGIWKYRIYGKSLTSKVIIDPKKEIIKDDGTKTYIHHSFKTLEDALYFIFEKIEEYINK